MVIELVGLPGAGKTYMAEKLSQEQKMPIAAVESRAEKIKLIVLFVVIHPSTFFFFLRRIFIETRNNRPLFRHKVRNLFFNTVAREQKARMMEVDCILDEGLLQFIFSLYERGITDRDVEEYFSYIKKDRKIALVEADTNVRARRMEERGHFPRALFGEEYRKEWLQGAEENYFILLPFAQTQFSDFEIIRNQ